MKTFGMSVEYYKLCRHPVFCYYDRKERVENMPKNIAVITGASGGLGREFVRLFTKDDSIQEIWAVARKKDKLEKLQKEFLAISDDINLKSTIKENFKLFDLRNEHLILISLDMLEEYISASLEKVSLVLDKIYR